MFISICLFVILCEDEIWSEKMEINVLCVRLRERRGRHNEEDIGRQSHAQPNHER